MARTAAGGGRRNNEFCRQKKSSDGSLLFRIMPSIRRNPFLTGILMRRSRGVLTQTVSIAPLRYQKRIKFAQNLILTTKNPALDV